MIKVASGQREQKRKCRMKGRKWKIRSRKRQREDKEVIVIKLMHNECTRVIELLERPPEIQKFTLAYGHRSTDESFYTLFLMFSVD